MINYRNSVDLSLIQALYNEHSFSSSIYPKYDMYTINHNIFSLKIGEYSTMYWKTVITN